MDIAMDRVDILTKLTSKNLKKGAHWAPFFIREKNL